MTDAADVRLLAVPNFPLVQTGSDLSALVLDCLRAAGLALESGDILVFAQKIVSKAEGCWVNLAAVTPSIRALALAAEVQKDPRLVQLVLNESRRVVRAAKDVLIVEHRLGFIMANAGIDQSNVDGSDDTALLLPKDPDRSAQRLRAEISARTGLSVAVLIADSFGRPWRLGTTGVAIGSAGLAAIQDLRGARDLFGRVLKVSVVGHADELAAAASLVMGQGAEGRPAVVIRGIARSSPHTSARALQRPSGEDLFQ